MSDPNIYDYSKGRRQLNDHTLPHEAEGADKQKQVRQQDVPAVLLAYIGGVEIMRSTVSSKD